ncbi:esterase family protein [Rhodococcus triatomae]|nr:alpha/beta hydrolase family protein [Rhodococcus triatomae]QNG19937.1 esterase family protein [Rhodococcus triatomae]QNG24148.1 esterase family protein [Rhodococcus triatomae]
MVVRKFGIRSAVALAAITAAPFLGTQAIASADPASSDQASHVVRTQKIDDRQQRMYVYSAAMDREIELRVLTPADDSAPRPTLYLLNGAGGGEDTATWYRQTDAVDFFADKNVNVVTPMMGAFSYYTDWKDDDPVLGRNQWTTFLTQELPPVIDSALGTNGVNSIAGISMAGGSVLSLAQAAPGLYESVGAYSGCAETSTNPGRAYVSMVVESRGRGKVENMWGPEGDPLWLENDPIVNAEKLRGTTLYVSTGSGLPGHHDRLDGQGINGDVETFANQIILGSVIEAATNQCTHKLANRLNELGIPATFDFQSTGTHAWPYWQDQLHKSWPVIAGPLGA